MDARTHWHNSDSDWGDTDCGNGSGTDGVDDCIGEGPHAVVLSFGMSFDIQVVDKGHVEPSEGHVLSENLRDASNGEVADHYDGLEPAMTLADDNGVDHG